MDHCQHNWIHHGDYHIAGVLWKWSDHFVCEMCGRLKMKISIGEGAKHKVIALEIPTENVNIVKPYHETVS